MSTGLDLAGKTFGRLTAVRKAGRDSSNNQLWECRCGYCGGITRRTAGNLRRSNTKSCGCLQRPNLTGQVFDRLTVLRMAGREHNTMWHCHCSCGAKTKVSTVNLQSGNSKSCGCLHRERTAERMRTHGEGYETAEYRCWASIKQRCYNKNARAYRYYGARGIKMYSKWRKSYPAFLEHIGRKPDTALSIDRIDNSKGYYPGNVRWATRSEQSLNQRKRRKRK